ncbi:vWA domain-containing protein [Shewanella gelidii]|uniref:VWFA domain-containing protein n=1 Tax=Shewanella gelidii TaxID=1642821 RepID=A0A917NCB6_9GAMM|nr:VWA domain-containing protein [Shewanella gelidii]MCL1098218.1 VWA domain-containing protein [Shewanella gelidii]GGI83490.1 hypothetical protein GCM10009332_20970 [Shewanella gelidii]
MTLHFIRPEWLWAIVPLLILCLISWRRKSHSHGWHRYIAPHLANVLVNGEHTTTKYNLYSLGFAWLIAVIALAGPAVNQQELPVFASQQGRVLVMDMSLSMYATDLTPNRLTQSRFRAIDFLKTIKDGETGLIAYAGDAFTISPLTTDSATLLNLIPTLSPDIMPVRGSNLALAINQAKSLLAQGGHIRGDIIVLTDGVSPDEFNESVHLLKQTGYRLGILALGSPQGSPIRLPDGQLLRNSSNELVITKTDYGLLQQLAAQSHGRVFIAQADSSEVTTLIGWLAQEGSEVETQLTGEAWRDLGPFVALLLIIPVLLSFRHGLFASLCLLFILPLPKSYAMDWQDLWQTKNQQAQQAYQANDYEKAANIFEHQQWQASALYKNGNYEAALKQFEQDKSARGHFNQGNALMQMGKYAEAQQRYQQALEKQPDFADARANLELAKQLANQQSNPNPSDADSSNNQEENNEQNREENSEGSEGSEGSEKNGQQNKSSHENSAEQNQSEQSSSEKDSSTQDSDAQKSQQANQNTQSATPEMAADPTQKNLNEQQAGSKEQAQQEQQAVTQQENDSSENDPSKSAQAQQQASVKQSEQALPEEMQQALQAIKEDPQILLRNKMQLEYEKRRQRGQKVREKQQW